MTSLVEDVKESKKEIHFDPKDRHGMLALMDRANEFTEPWFGKNSEGEDVMISVNSDNITTETFQNNGWARENVYWRDFTVEELYHKIK